MEERKYTKQEIYEIISKEIKRQLEFKKRYIAINGSSHKDVLKEYETVLVTLSSVYYLFE